MTKRNDISGDRFFHPKTCQECVVVFIKNSSIYAIFNLETGNTEFETDDYEGLIRKLKKYDPAYQGKAHVYWERVKAEGLL